MLIEKAAVIGAGTMGCGIATHLANAGVPSLLLDVVPGGADAEGRSRLAVDALARAGKARPAAFMDPSAAALVTPGNIEDDLHRIAECDWVIEAVTEDLGIKRDLYGKIAASRRPGTIVSSNTSGISLGLLTDGMDEEFRQHFLITHFFNPPRYMFLLEVVRGPDTIDAVWEAVRSFADVRLGKGIVECKDTPNFIANRIGVFCMGLSCRLLQDSGLTVEEVDAITGPVMGRPKTATFRLHDLVGNDVAVLVMKNVRELLPDDESRDLFAPPAWLERMVAEGKLGRKAGAGFYKKEGKEILVLDLDTFEYRPQKTAEFDSLAAAKKGKTLAEKLRIIVAGDDAASRYAWRQLSETLLYAARRVPEISDDLTSVDRAMRWGFNWELGPFEIWDALGVRDVIARLEKEGRDVPGLVRKLLAAGCDSFWAWPESVDGGNPAVFDIAAGARTAVPDRDGVIRLDDVRRRGAPVCSNASASVWDIGDGVLCVEFTSKMNTISSETLETIHGAVELAESDGWAGVVIGNQAAHFSLGANLVELSTAAEKKDWKAIEAMIREFHRTVLRVRYSPKPVVAVVQGMALGGGCEIPLACDRVQAAAEAYMGLVELGVGLIPAGGGTREMACRAAECVPPGIDAGAFPFLSAYFQNIVMAKTSASAADARRLGYLRAVDAVSMNRDRAIGDGKRQVLALATTGYAPPRSRDAIRVAGESGIAEFSILLHQYRSGGFISEYDEFLANKLAYVICGGAINADFPVSEQHLLDLECEVFIGLVGQQKTLDRIAHTLKTGKPLRN